MKTNLTAGLAFGTLALTAAALSASPVRLVATAHVERNDFLSVTTTFHGVPDDFHNGAGAQVKLVINLNSDNYVDSAFHPVRGYTFGVNDLTLDAGSVHAVLRADRTLNYLCLRNNDPGVDGVFTSVNGPDAFDEELPLAMVPNNYGVDFLYSFNNATPFPSLDILQCTGTYAYEQIGVYNFTIQHGENSTPMLFWFTNFSITKQCSKSDIGGQGGVPGFDQILDNNDFVVFIDYFFNSNPIADMGVQGGLPGTDGLFDNNDFVVFIEQFFTGC